MIVEVSDALIGTGLNAPNGAVRSLFDMAARIITKIVDRVTGCELSKDAGHDGLAIQNVRQAVAR